ncbi:hypothetical protein WDU94_013123 [Cyamophila willieti]
MNLLENLLILGFCGSVLSNYPDSYTNEKPCMRIKNTVNTIAPICVPDGKNFLPVSVANCRKLKDDCPEFNEVECMWYAYQPPGLPGKPLMLPTCRVKYYAKKYTWGEVYYTNQYGTNPAKTVFDIVELHRFIKNHDAFPFEQKDWPDNVLDNHGERGVPWIKLEGERIPFTTKYYKPSPTPLCQGLADANDNCKNSVREYMEKSYAEGILSKRLPKASKRELDSRAEIEIVITAKCDAAMVDLVKTPVCRVTYDRKSDYNYHAPGLVETAVNKTAIQQFLEVHMWQKKDADPKKDGDNAFGLHYAYFNYHPPLDT